MFLTVFTKLKSDSSETVGKIVVQNIPTRLPITSFQTENIYSAARNYNEYYVNVARFLYREAHTVRAYCNRILKTTVLCAFTVKAEKLRLW